MSLSRYLVQFCYELEDSTRYKHSKQFFYDLIENPRYRMRPYFDLGISDISWYRCFEF